MRLVVADAITGDWPHGTHASAKAAPTCLTAARAGLASEQTGLLSCRHGIWTVSGSACIPPLAAAPTAGRKTGDSADE